MRKNTARHQRYKNIKPIGTMTFNTFFGIAVFEPDEIDRYNDNCNLIAAWTNGEGKEGYCNYHKHKIYCTSSGREYIRKGHLKVYLDEMVRIG